MTQRHRILSYIVLVSLFCLPCKAADLCKKEGATLSPTRARAVIARRANEVIIAIKNHDMQLLASYVHPDKGLLFSTVSSFSKDDVHFTREQVKALWNDTSMYIWGVYDSGDDIVLTFRDYYAEFIYDHDFANAEKIRFNEKVIHPNSSNNISEFFPGSIQVEYYFSGFQTKYKGFDWKALTLVFLEVSGRWYLVGVAHDQWSM